MDNKLIK